MSARSTATALLGVVLFAAPGVADVQARPVAGTAGAAPVVQSMIVGSTGAILSPARSVTASAGTVRVAGRSCAVASATPLAVLAVVSRAGGPGFSLRDYGRCGASPANSAQLFVNSLAGESNRGQSGWEYKVNGVSGTTGAGDPSGPEGNGRRLSAGQRVVWFWCAAYAGGCQRSLEVSASASVGRGRTLSVTVTGRDNEGRAVPVAGAIVTLGSDFASTGSSGRTVLYAPSAAGSYQLSATRRGLVPSFPETIVVR